MIIFEDQYKVASYHINIRNRASLYSLLSFIQDIGWLHSRKLAIRQPQNMGWVFTRQKLSMNHWPAWDQLISIRTWLRKPTGAFIFRDYEILHDGNIIGKCTSTFTAIDLQTRKIAIQNWDHFPPCWKEEGTFDTVPEKIIWNAQVGPLAEFQVRNSDIDTNHHVNNTKYAQWILDAIPFDELMADRNLIEYEVNFLAEAKLGDVISIGKVDLQENLNFAFQFQGTKRNDQRPIFSARLIVDGL